MQTNNHRAIEDGSYTVDQIFNFDFYGCRVVPDILLKMIRSYYPRVEGEKVDYPPPFTPEGGDFKYEFPSGNGIENQNPPYAPGPPHWCTKDYLDTGNWVCICVYKVVTLFSCVPYRIQIVNNFDPSVKCIDSHYIHSFVYIISLISVRMCSRARMLEMYVLVLVM